MCVCSSSSRSAKMNSLILLRAVEDESYSVCMRHPNILINFINISKKCPGILPLNYKKTLTKTIKIQIS